ncbi:hypothetical protein [Ramlibacter rhizophilus]|uniref:Uncharacterized protein n=1 Tax=Ramlibacter rhizophilus TaxID=1781167 RepID=A0A4Z0BEV7_9BURK|nr:hypothetical protein [Ramlibacter rhizophilus]TFY96857.1 hypothetical protein EZ242_19480 [Ramlibacter rhizophilus]
MTPDPDKSERPDTSDRERAARADDRQDRTKSTPSTDMQPEDAGTDASAPPEGHATGGSTPAENAMKQQSKTDAERRR